MKKLLALGISLAMMASLSTVAFALPAEQEMEAAGNSDEVVVNTTLDAETYEEWTVTIPADVTIAWNNYNAYELPVKVSGRIVAGSKIDISATAIDALTNDDASLATTWTVPADLSATAAELADADQTMTYKIAVNTGEFAKGGLPVGVYSGTTTFTVAR